jgi:hypothetical protein
MSNEAIRTTSLPEELEVMGEDDYNEDEDFDCGFICGRGCEYAGSEICEFECPYRAALVASPYYPNCDLDGHEAGDPNEGEV